MSKLWRANPSQFYFYIDAKHKRELRNIRRSRKHWDIVATYEKNGKIIAYQYAVPDWEYRKAKRIEKRINNSCIYGHKTA